MNTSRLPILIPLFGSVFTLAACGGGNGGNDGDRGSPGFTLSTSQIAFSAVQNGPAPAQQTVAVNVTGGTVYVRVERTGLGISAPTTNCAGSSCTITLSPIGTNSAPTTFNAVVTVTGCPDQFCNSQVSGSPKTINVAYTITEGSALSLSSYGVSFLSSPGNAPASQTVAVNATTPATSWTSSVSYGSPGSAWLNVPASGSTATPLITLSASPLGIGSYSATVTFTPVGGGIAAPMLVSYRVRPSGVYFVAPYVATANTSSEVIIRGAGFSSLSAPGVMFGSLPATTARVVNDSEIRATYPSLPVGRYSVSVGNPAQTLTSRAELVVVAPQAYSYSAIVRSGTEHNALRIHSILFDPERKTIYLYDANSVPDPAHNLAETDQIERYRFAGAWSADQVIKFDTILNNKINPQARLTLTPDGRELVKTAYSSVLHIDPISGTTIADVSSWPAFGNTSKLQNGGMANDGGLIGVARATLQQFPTLTSGEVAYLYRYDILDRTYSPITAPPALTYTVNRQMLSSYDGSRVLMADADFSPSPGGAFAAFNTTNANVEIGTYMSNFGVIGTTANGQRAILKTRTDNSCAVVDNGTTLVGGLPMLDAAALSPDGQRAYTYVSSTNSIHKYDLNSWNVSTGFGEIGSPIVLADRPGVDSVFNYLGYVMIITPDGNTLILAGSERVIVIPAN